MSHFNDSFASNSRAASVAFRQNELRRARIFFPPEVTDCPIEIEELKIQICRLPMLLKVADTALAFSEAIKQLEDSDRAFYEEVWKIAGMVDRSSVQSCSLQHERVWMREVNEPTLTVFFRARRQGMVSTTEDFVWKEGKELTNAYSPMTLNDPKPDVAIGLKPLQRSVRDSQSPYSLSNEVLEILRESPQIGLIYSPSHRRDIIYPAIIYEAKSDSNPILWAENQAAVGAARAIGLLADLSRLAEDTQVAPVFVITSAGSLWQVHIAFVGPGGQISLSPLLSKKLSLEDTNERFHLQVILHRIFGWLLGPFADLVNRQLCTLWDQLNSNNGTTAQ